MRPLWRPWGGCQGLPCRAGRQGAEGARSQLHQRRAWSAVEQAEKEVGSEDFSEAKQSQRATEKDFMEKAAAEAEALRLKELRGLQREVKAVNALETRYAGLPVFHPKVPYSGVTWGQGRQQWHAQCDFGGVKRHFRVKPKDHSEEELERSFQVAVSWKKRQEKEKMTTSKAKAKPQKKQRKCSALALLLLKFQTAR